jgi:cytochrome o ubiquinol oxidase subunit 2
VILATLAFAWWFRSSNDRAIHLPNWSYSGRLEFIVWSIPAMVVLFLAGIGWVGSHDLDPSQRIGGKPAALEVQVVALDWKWLFIYPGQGVASVNQLVLPAGQPVAFRLTSASVMNSFLIPRLGSQIYAMAGMATRLNLEADRPGIYPGLSAQFSGDGFSGMNFNARVVTPAQFAAWVGAARTGPPLDLAAYARLARPSENVPPLAWGTVAPDLFTRIVDMTAPGVSGTGPPTEHLSQREREGPVGLAEQGRGEGEGLRWVGKGPHDLDPPKEARRSNRRDRNPSPSHASLRAARAPPSPSGRGVLRAAWETGESASRPRRPA